MKLKKERKNLLEMILVSLFFLSFTVAALFFLQKAFPEEFDRITGHVITSVYVLPAPPADCNMTFQPGWNLLSFFCISTLEDRVFLENITNYTAIFTYRTEDSLDPWKVYNPSLPSWVVQDLTYLSRIDAYWMYFNMSNTSNFFFNGSKRVTAIPLLQGWNLVGFTTNIPKLIEESLISINDSYTVVYSYNNTGKNYLLYTKGSGGTLNETKPYQGYWINMNSSGTWVIDW